MPKDKDDLLENQQQELKVEFDPTHEEDSLPLDSRAFFECLLLRWPILRKTLLLDCDKADVQLKELDQVQVMLQVEPKGVFHEVIILPASMTTTENDGHSSFLEKV